MATKSGRYVNWSGVSFTPSGGTATPITRVRSVSVNPRPKVLTGSADADLYPTTKRVIYADPSVEVETEDISITSVLSVGTRGSFTATLLDAVNADGTGAITVTLTGAIIVDGPWSDQHQAFGSVRIPMEAETADGVTPPLSISIAP